MIDKIFSSNEDYTKTAFLNWRVAKHEDIGNMLVLADGFISSAIQLCQDCLNDNEDKKADNLIFPILHNANHGIELYLKSMVWTLNKLIGSEYKIEGNHNIEQIFSTVKAKIKTYKDKEWMKHSDEQNKGLQEYISELFNLISGYGKGDNMDFSRYPITDKYENHFYIDRLDNVEIDIEKLKIRLTNIKESLDERASYFFYQELKGDW
jgi:hypothetical protein